MGGKAYPGVKKIEELLNIPAETDEERKEREEYMAKYGIPTKVNQTGVPHEVPYSVKPKETKFQDDKVKSLTERIWKQL